MKKIIFNGCLYEEFDYKNPIHGGLGDNKNSPTKSELKMGINVEKEHIGKNKELSEKQIDAVSRDIAEDHLAEFPIKTKGKGYYSELEKMEDKLKDQLSNEKRQQKRNK